MKTSELHLPHFLRFTRALALVSGMAIPASVAAGCGGDIFGYDGVAVGSATCEDACAPPDNGDGASGVRDGGNVYDGQPMGTVAYDGGPTGVAPPYDGGPVGVTPYDAGIGDAAGGGVSFPPDSSDVSMGGGGPLVAPELPA
jgi:hypothetical protein